MYHHFEDYAHLVEEVQVARFAAGMDQTLVAISRIGRDSRNKQEAVASFHALTAEMSAPNRSGLRLERARLLGASLANPRLKKRLAQEQVRLTDALTELVLLFQAKGWACPDLDPRAVAVLMQAYTLGKVVDDIVDQPMSETGWNQLINRVVDQVFAG